LSHKWFRRLFGKLRTRLLICFTFTVGGLLFVTVPISRRLIVNQISEREQRSLQESLAAYLQFVQQEMGAAEGYSSAQLQTLMKEFLRSELPEDDHFMISIVDSKFHAASPVALPPPLQPGSPLMVAWERSTSAHQGTIDTDDEQVGSIVFHTQPLVLGGRVRGVFVAAITTGGEIREATELIHLLSRIFLALLLISFLVYWHVASVLLAPLTRLAAATRSIGTYNLNVRVPEEGFGELSDISRSFNAMLNRLEALIIAQRDFLRDAGHELRTPLTVIRGHLELIPNERNEADRRQTVELLLDEIDRMSRLVNELSLLAHSERPEFLHCRPFALNAFTYEVFRKASSLVGRRWHLVNRGTGTLEADCDRLTQCLMNLVQNAVRHTGPQDHIEIGSQRDADGTVRLWVSDSGSGIEPGLQNRIFDRFVRGPTLPDEPGAGLGLSIVKSIMAAHGGTVNVTSTPGQGSTFTLLLPGSVAHRAL
jgi:signal transduction histidine kinase